LKGTAYQLLKILAMPEFLWCWFDKTYAKSKVDQAFRFDLLIKSVGSTQ
jgi:hypothetical protein